MGLPELGARIPVEKFHVSQCNVNFDEPFGESDQDKVLVKQVSLGKKLAQPFKARPENDGFGVYMGRRRFLALKTVGRKQFEVGLEVLLTDIDEAEARRMSVIENLKILRQEMNPIRRAQQLNKLISGSPDSLRGTARRMGISPTTLSEWMKVLELSPKMQEAVADGKLYYTDALRLTKMKLGELGEEKLAEVLNEQGYDAFKDELERTTTGKLKRGIPADKYFIERITFDKYYDQDMTLHERLTQLANQKNMKLNDYIKKVLLDHIASVR